MAIIQEYKLTPHEEAVEKILLYLEEQNLKPDDRLPGERVMCGMWDLNRSTLRSAIWELMERGVLYNKTGAGTFVKEPKLKWNLQDLESISERARELGRSLESVVIEQRMTECNKKQAAAFAVPLGHKVLHLVRLRKLDATPVMIETTEVKIDGYDGILQHDFSRESLYDVLETYGVTGHSGSEKIRITFATPEEAEILEIAPGTALFYLSGEVRDEAGRLIERFKTVARSDKLQFTSRLARK